MLCISDINWKMYDTIVLQCISYYYRRLESIRIMLLIAKAVKSKIWKAASLAVCSMYDVKDVVHFI